MSRRQTVKGTIKTRCGLVSSSDESPQGDERFDILQQLNSETSTNSGTDKSADVDSKTNRGVQVEAKKGDVVVTAPIQ